MLCALILALVLTTVAVLCYRKSSSAKHGEVAATSTSKLTSPELPYGSRISFLHFPHGVHQCVDGYVYPPPPVNVIYDEVSVSPATSSAIATEPNSAYATTLNLLPETVTAIPVEANVAYSLLPISSA